MIDIFLILLILIQIYAVYSFANVAKKLDTPKEKQPTFINPIVTRGATEFTNESTIGQSDESVIVMPKSPQRIDWEEQEELRKMNLGRPR